MKKYILPGFSKKNKDWVDQVSGELSQGVGVYWKHWDNNKPEENWIENEAQNIINNSNGEKFNIIAKSAGTLVCMSLLRTHPDLVNRVILCGIPIEDFQPGDEDRYEPLRNFPTEKILCIQNVLDNHGTYEKIEVFIHRINKNIIIVSKTRGDHEYPYIEDFESFINKA